MSYRVAECLPAAQPREHRGAGVRGGACLLRWGGSSWWRPRGRRGGDDQRGEIISGGRPAFSVGRWRPRRGRGRGRHGLPPRPRWRRCGGRRGRGRRRHVLGFPLWGRWGRHVRWVSPLWRRRGRHLHGLVRLRRHERRQLLHLLQLLLELLLLLLQKHPWGHAWR